MIGALLGLVVGAGLWWALSPLLRRDRLVDRLAPYLRDTPRPSRLLAGTGAPAGPAATLARLARPVLVDLARAVEPALGGSRSVRRRLAALRSTRTVEDVRVEQVACGVAGLLLGFAAGGLAGALSGRPGVVVVLLLGAVGAVTGVAGRDWWLGFRVRRREERILAELPAVAELLALAVTAGEAPAAALDRVARLSGGELATELAAAVAAARAGTGLTVALEELAGRTTVEPLARFLTGMVVAIERGTPLADVLRAQAADVREAGKRELLASGGRREIAMLVPVVFLVLPITVLFALFPGLVSITLLTR